MAQKVTSTDIKLALKEFHNGKPSYFITECKTCSTYFPDPQGLLKFDGLAITKSYRALSFANATPFYCANISYARLKIRFISSRFSTKKIPSCRSLEDNPFSII